MRPTIARFTAASALLVLVACGTTVPLPPGAGTAAGPTAVSGNNGLGVTTTPVPGSTDPAVASNGLGTTFSGGSTPVTGSGTYSSGSPGASPLTPAGSTPTSPSGQPSGSTSPPPSSSNGNDGENPAATPPPGGEVQIGFIVVENGAAANATIGASGISQGPSREYIRIVVEDINRRGGLAGRKVEPLIFAMDAQSAQTEEQQWEQACQFWTEDNEVFAADVPAATRDNMRACMGNRGVPLVASGLTLEDRRGLEKFPQYVETDTMNLSRISTNLVEGLSAHDYFAPEVPAQPTKVGIVRYDYETFERASDEYLKPALARAGIGTDDITEFAVHLPDNANDLGPTATDINSAILRFQEEGVNHVLILETTAILAFLFMRSAENQRYRPQYGLHSQNGGMLISEQEPPEQLHNAVGIGWIPLIDVRPKDVPTLPARERCLRMMRDEGITFEDGNAMAVALTTCDSGWMLKAAADAVGRDLTQANLVSGMESLGSSFASTQTFTTRFSHSQHDGAAAYRLVRYFDDCGCFKYTSKMIAAK